VTPKPKIRLIRKMDHLQGSRWLWEAYRNHYDGGGSGWTEYGTVQADYRGEAVDEETWEDAE
jgi:hypothetical protein